MIRVFSCRRARMKERQWRDARTPSLLLSLLQSAQFSVHMAGPVVPWCLTKLRTKPNTDWTAGLSSVHTPQHTILLYMLLMARER